MDWYRQRGAIVTIIIFAIVGFVAGMSVEGSKSASDLAVTSVDGKDITEVQK